MNPHHIYACFKQKITQTTTKKKLMQRQQLRDRDISHQVIQTKVQRLKVPLVIQILNLPKSVRRSIFLVSILLLLFLLFFFSLFFFL